MNLDEWLNKKIWPAEARMTEDMVYWGARLACLEMIKSGTTFFNDMYWHPRGTARAAEASGLRAAISSVMIDVGGEPQREEHIKLNKDVYNESKDWSDRIQFHLGPHALYTMSKEALEWVADFSKKNDVMIHFHLSETEKEVKDCVDMNGIRPVEYLEKIGFLSNRLVCCHSVWLNQHEIDLLAKNNVAVIHNPVSNMKLSVGSCFPYDGYRKAGMRMGLGTDGCASNNNLDMFEEMKIAGLLRKHHTGSPTSITAKNVFDMATNSRIFRHDTGISEGKDADIVLLNRNQVSMIPAHDLISNIVYSANGSVVDTTICDGKILMQNGVVKGEKEILSNFKAKQKELDL